MLGNIIESESFAHSTLNDIRIRQSKNQLKWSGDFAALLKLAQGQFDAKPVMDKRTWNKALGRKRDMKFGQAVAGHDWLALVRQILGTPNAKSETALLILKNIVAIVSKTKEKTASKTKAA